MISQNSRFRWTAAALALVIATAFITTQVVSDDKSPPKGKGQEMTPEMQKMMEQCAKAATPGPQHKQLAALAGAWDVTSKFWMDPNAPASESKGISKVKTVLGGRWVVEEFDGEMPQGPFSGMSITGFDNVKKKYVNFWMDTMGTGAMTSEGSADPSGKIITYTCSFDDPMIGKTKTFRSISRIISESKHTFEMFDKSPDGKEFKCLDIVYTRK